MDRRMRLALTSVLLLAAVILFAAGCSTDRSTSPVAARSTGSTPDFAVEISGRSAAVTLANGGESGLRGNENTQQGIGNVGSVSLKVDGAVGGTLALGRFTLTFPAGAFQGTKVITLVDATDPYVGCHLLPEGLQFDVPVTLEVQLGGTTADDSSATVFWYNPTTDVWEDIGGQYQTDTHSVLSSLHHFSDYRSGRAGW